MGVSLKLSYDQVKPVLRLDRTLSMPGRYYIWYFYLCVPFFL